MPNHPADERAHKRNHGHLASHAAANMPSQQAKGNKQRFESRRNDCGDSPRDDTDHNVMRFPKHRTGISRLRAESLADLQNIAQTFARTLRPGDVVAFSGAIGSGKTTFISVIVRTLHGLSTASSPTFIFRQRYEGTPPIEHLDLYRLEDPRELSELGLEEAFSPDAITLLEWPERAPALLPAGSIRVTIIGAGDEPRMLEIVA
jgi:tRNA threonylcarbamoyladenosine biosynthesis protein TsaE